MLVMAGALDYHQFSGTERDERELVMQLSLLSAALVVFLIGDTSKKSKQTSKSKKNQ